MDEPKPKRAVVDWESVESAYRAGIRSLKDIGAEYGVSDAGIIKRAKRDGWARDLTAKIAAKAEAKVSAALVSEEVSEQRSANEREIVEAGAAAQANAILGQRKDVARARGVVSKLFSELEMLMDGIDTLEQMEEVLAGGDDEAMADILRKVSQLPTQADVAKKLSDALRVLVELERKVLRIKDDDPLDDAAKRFGAAAAMSAADAYARMVSSGKSAA